MFETNDKIEANTLQQLSDKNEFNFDYKALSSEMIKENGKEFLESSIQFKPKSLPHQEILALEDVIIVGSSHSILESKSAELFSSVKDAIYQNFQSLKSNEHYDSAQSSALIFNTAPIQFPPELPIISTLQEI